jgi:dTDP-4-amino-4,6-dideoxygalactose transaminase
MAQGVHQITADFEKALCKYTGAPFAVALDNMSNALFLALYYELNVLKTKVDKYGDKVILCPKYTYPSVPCEIIHAGGKVEFVDMKKLKPFKDHSAYLKGPYNLAPTNVVDSALRFTNDMYIPGKHMCLSFTGPYKHLKLGKGGAILTYSYLAYKWFKKARFSGRDELSYHEDDFDQNPVVGWNFYMMPEIAARGLLLMTQFYTQEGKPISNPDLELPYPDLSKYKIFQK